MCLEHSFLFFSRDTPEDDAVASKVEATIQLFKTPIPKFIPRLDLTKSQCLPPEEIPRVVINPNGNKTLRIVCLSDTHCRFDGPIPDGDILIHSGDISNNGLDREYTEFNAMLSKCTHPHKILVFGNHDHNVERLSPERLQKKFPGVAILTDQQITIEGIKIYGSPWTGHGMAFNSPHDSEDMRKKFDFPSDTDILVTHVPPLLISDLAAVSAKESERIIQERDPCVYCDRIHSAEYHWGSRQLLEIVLTKKPKIHQFGHVHDKPKTIIHEGTVFINAALDHGHPVRVFDCIV